MNTPTKQGSRRKLIKVASALMLASALGSLAATPALARDDHHHGGHDRGHRGHGGGVGFDVDLYAPDPVYAPQPYYGYDPYPSPGINISVPLHLGHRR
jgi:hypothetical protein